MVLLGVLKAILLFEKVAFVMIDYYKSKKPAFRAGSMGLFLPP